MVQYVCDVCKCSLDSDDLRYVVRMEVYAAPDNAASEAEDDCDHLQELADVLEMMDDEDELEVGDDLYQQLRFDLCADCRKKFLSDPLGRRMTPHYNFSKN